MSDADDKSTNLYPDGGVPPVQQPVAVFLSYSRLDREFALRVTEDLKSAGADVWLDHRDIRAGARWDRAVEEALGACQSFIVVLSPASVKSSNVLDEVSFAIDHDKQIVPILYQDCAVPLRLRRIQYQDFRNEYAEGLSGLVRTLRLIEAPGQTGFVSQTSSQAAAGHNGFKPGSNKRPIGRLATPARVVLAASGFLAVASLSYMLLSNPRNSAVGKAEEQPDVVTGALKAPAAVPMADKPAVKSEASSTSTVQPQITLSADEISGEWLSEVFTDPNDPQSRPQQYHFKFKAAGSCLFGNARLAEPPKNPGAPHGIGKGRIDGNQISFEFFGGWTQSDGRGGQRRLKESFFGIISKGAIDFTYQLEESTVIEFKAKKAAGTSTH